MTKNVIYKINVVTHKLMGSTLVSNISSAAATLHVNGNTNDPMCVLNYVVPSQGCSSVALNNTYMILL